MRSQAIKITLSYLFFAQAVLAYALTLQILFELSTSGVHWRTATALVTTTLLASGLHYLARSPKMQVAYPSGTTDGSAHQVKRSRPLMPTLAATAASIALSWAVVFGALKHSTFERTVTTANGQVEHITPQDGSTVHVDARSKVKIEYTTEARIVHLYRGRAVFDVAKDRFRPFVVKTPWVNIIAVGTRFGVSLDAGVTITVSEGIVNVTTRSSSGSTLALRSGEELQVPVADTSHVVRVDAERKLQWTRGMLVLDGWTVAEAVAEFNCRNSLQIIVDDPALANRVVRFATIRADAPRTYAELIAKEAGVKMTEENGVIRLSE